MWRRTDAPRAWYMYFFCWSKIDNSFNSKWLREMPLSLGVIFCRFLSIFVNEMGVF
jgi:hypothetical protein